MSQNLFVVFVFSAVYSIHHAVNTVWTQVNENSKEEEKVGDIRDNLLNDI